MAKLISISSHAAAKKIKIQNQDNHLQESHEQKTDNDTSIDTPFATKVDLQLLEHRISKWIVGSLAIQTGLFVIMILILFK
jgi:hypothetical protein